MNKFLTSLLSIYSLSTLCSHAALLLTFSEESGDVVMRASGSVDVSNGTLANELNFVWNEHSLNFFQVRTTINLVNVIGEGIRGVDLLAVDLVPSHVAATTASGNGDFAIFGDVFWAFASTDSGIKDNGVKEATITASERVLTFSGQTFDSMGLSAHAKNTPIGLWAARAGATDAETVNFVVASVPEPSSSSLIALASLGILTRRRR